MLSFSDSYLSSSRLQANLNAVVLSEMQSSFVLEVLVWIGSNCCNEYLRGVYIPSREGKKMSRDEKRVSINITGDL